MNALTDTKPETEIVLLKLLRQTPVWRKLQLMTQLNDMTRVLALGGIRQQHPHATADQLQRLLADRLLGLELAAIVYGPKPSLKERADVL
jgi:hypothetical protein